MITECIILFRIKYFKHCGRWITAEIIRHFINFIKKEYRD